MLLVFFTAQPDVAMSKAFQLILRSERGRDVQIRGELAEEEFALLELYLEHHQRLTASDETGLSVTADLPDSDTLSILLHRLRPFILQSEPASFVRVASILGKAIPHPAIRNLVQGQRAMFEGRISQDTSAGVVANAEKVLQEWLEVDAPMAGMPPEFARGLFLSMLADKTEAIDNLASLVAVVVGKTGQLQFQARRVAE